MKLVFHAVKNNLRQGSVVAMRPQYISSCVIASGRLYENDRLSNRTWLRVTSRAIVTGATNKRNVNAVITSDLDLDAILRSQTR